jgi:hypothetical protein
MNVTAGVLTAILGAALQLPTAAEAPGFRPLQSVPPRPGAAGAHYGRDYDRGTRTHWGWVSLENFHDYAKFGDLVFSSR